MRPDAPSRLLVVSTLPWIYPARLVCRLRSVGFEVEAACLPDNAIESVSPPMAIHPLHALSEARGVAAAIARVQPYLVVPCDDRATAILHALYARGDKGLRNLIERSLGDPAGYGIVRSKRAVLELARSLRIAAPRTASVDRFSEAKAEALRRGFPIVLKRDGTWGGKGVRIVREACDLTGAWNELTSRSPVEALRRVRTHRSLAPLGEMAGLTRVAIDVQDYVTGLPANRAVVCDRGRVLAGLSVLALETQTETGAASVVRAVDNPQMEKAAAALTEKLGLSGFVGFDFMVSEETGEALLLEINPRATPISHLALAGRPHLPQALAEAMLERAVAQPDKALTGEIVMLFPNEISRDPGSGYHASAAHDVPFGQPGLIARVTAELEQSRPGSAPRLASLARAAS